MFDVEWLLPNNHLRVDVNTFQFSLTATDVIVLGNAVVNKVGHVLFDDPPGEQKEKGAAGDAQRN